MSEFTSEQYLQSAEVRRVYELSDIPKFDALLAAASKICFGELPDYQKNHCNHTGDSAVVKRLGAAGLRAERDTASLLTMESDVVAGLDKLWRQPDQLSGSYHDEVIHKATQFGDRLLAEAFKCLGQDAYEQVARWQQATSDEEQQQILAWLDGRLVKITDPKYGIELSEQSDAALNDGVYSPVRLSPRAIGRYPAIKLAPTCLGVSVLAASFFQKAGARHLHAGVMQTRLQAEDTALSALLDETIEQYPYEELIALRDRLQAHSRQDTGYHALNVVRLQSGEWYQFDVNLNSCGSLGDLDAIYADMYTAQMLLPNPEHSLVRNDSQSIAAATVAWARDMVDFATSNYDETDCRQLLTAYDESIEETIRQRLIGSITSGLETIEGYTMLSTAFTKAFRVAFQHYVLWDQPIDEVVQRCRQDESYLQRRVADIAHLTAILPPLVAVSFRNTLAADMLTFEHTKLEAGFPAQRIGMAVLNDFNSYVDSGLSPAFWVNHWGSKLAVAEAAARLQPADEDLYGDMIRAQAAYSQATGLYYNKDYDIIN